MGSFKRIGPRTTEHPRAVNPNPAPVAACEAEIPMMRTLAQSVYIDSEFGALSELPSAGSPLENPYVYDASARELKAMATQGLVKIVHEQRRSTSPEALISHLTFKRLR
jgi:hypothetical protein